MSDSNGLCPLYGLELEGQKIEDQVDSHPCLTFERQHAGFPLTLELEGDNLPKRSWVKISQIRTLSRQRLGRRIGRLEPEQLDLLVEGLNELVAA